MARFVALKGRNNVLMQVCVSPFQGLHRVSMSRPRALPWAVMFQPFRLKRVAMSVRMTQPAMSVAAVDAQSAAEAILAKAQGSRAVI
jgi:hypothetical protein